MNTMNYTMKRIGAGASVAAASLLPLLAAAQGTVGQGTATGGLQVAISRVQQIFNQLIPLLLVIALFWFMYGLVMYIMSDLEDKEKGRTIMIYGIIALFVMTTVWGLVGFVGDTIGIRSTDYKAPNILKDLPPVIDPRTGN